MLEDNKIIQSKYQYSTMFLGQAQPLYSEKKKAETLLWPDRQSSSQP